MRYKKSRQSLQAMYADLKKRHSKCEGELVPLCKGFVEIEKILDEYGLSLKTAVLIKEICQKLTPIIEKGMPGPMHPANLKKTKECEKI